MLVGVLFFYPPLVFKVSWPKPPLSPKTSEMSNSNLPALSETELLKPGNTLYAKDIEKTYLTQENAAVGYSCVKVSNLIAQLRKEGFSSDSKVLRKEAIKRCLTNYTYSETEGNLRVIQSGIENLIA